MVILRLRRTGNRLIELGDWRRLGVGDDCAVKQVRLGLPAEGAEHHAWRLWRFLAFIQAKLWLRVALSPYLARRCSTLAITDDRLLVRTTNSAQQSLLSKANYRRQKLWSVSFHRQLSYEESVIYLLNHTTFWKVFLRHFVLSVACHCDWSILASLMASAT